MWGNVDFYEMWWTACKAVPQEESLVFFFFSASSHPRSMKLIAFYRTGNVLKQTAQQINSASFLLNKTACFFFYHKSISYFPTVSSVMSCWWRLTWCMVAAERHVKSQERQHVSSLSTPSCGPGEDRWPVLMLWHILSISQAKQASDNYSPYRLPSVWNLRGDCLPPVPIHGTLLPLELTGGEKGRTLDRSCCPSRSSPSISPPPPQLHK